MKEDHLRLTCSTSLKLVSREKLEVGISKSESTANGPGTDSESVLGWAWSSGIGVRRAIFVIGAKSEGSLKFNKGILS